MCCRLFFGGNVTPGSLSRRCRTWPSPTNTPSLFLVLVSSGVVFSSQLDGGGGPGVLRNRALALFRGLGGGVSGTAKIFLRVGCNVRGSAVLVTFAELSPGEVTWVRRRWWMRSFTERSPDADEDPCCRLVDEPCNDGWTVLAGLIEAYLLYFLGMEN